jgi:hypothetical protein
MHQRFTVLIGLLMVTTILNAQGTGIGVGISWSGLNGKYWMNDHTALAAQLSNTALAADYLLHKPDMLKLTDTPTPVYYGGGIVLGTHEEWDITDAENKTKLDLGARGIIGISYYLSSFPIDIFFEDAPTLYLLGGRGFDLVNGTFGIRYFF